MQEFLTSEFWLGLGAITGVNLALSGDNAVVIALGARSLPEPQRRQIVIWGAGAAAVLRVFLTIVASNLLTLPYIKLIGGALLFWIAVKPLGPGRVAGNAHRPGSNVAGAVKTILIADLVMSLDNVLALAALARGNTVLLVLGLMISIPFMVFGAAMLIRLMGRYPFVVTGAAVLIGYVAGEMLVDDPFVMSRLGAYVHRLDLELFSVFHQSELSASGLVGAALVAAAKRGLVWIKADRL